MWVRQEEVGLWCMSCVVILQRHIFEYRDSTMLFSLVFSIGILCALSQTHVKVSVCKYRMWIHVHCVFGRQQSP
jgi:hypothetical protein